MITMSGDPIKWIIDICNTLTDTQPNVNVEYVTREYMDKIISDEESTHVDVIEPGECVYGVTVFDEDTSTPNVVYVCNDIMMVDAPAIVAHECAHVICGVEAGHGEEFEKMMDLTHEQYMIKYNAYRDIETTRN